MLASIVPVGTGTPTLIVRRLRYAQSSLLDTMMVYEVVESIASIKIGMHMDGRVLAVGPYAEPAKKTAYVVG